MSTPSHLAGILGAFISIGSFGLAGSAQAEVAPSQCAAESSALEQGRGALEGLEEAVTSAKSDRAALRAELAEIETRIGEAAPPERRALAQRRQRAAAQLETIATLLPPIENQARALANQVAAAQLEYARCQGAL